MANAGAAWDNAKRSLRWNLRRRGRRFMPRLSGDTVGDPFKDTSSVAMNPVIKFTTLFGMLAVELAVSMSKTASSSTMIIAGVFLLISFVFVYRSFYSMRIRSEAA